MVNVTEQKQLRCIWIIPIWTTKHTYLKVQLVENITDRHKSLSMQIYTTTHSITNYSSEAILITVKLNLE